MERRVNLLSSCYLIFVAMLLLSGSLAGILSEAVYFLAFLLPFAIAVIRSREKLAFSKYLVVKKEDISFLAPLIFPTVSIVIVISLVTSFVIGRLTGVQNSTDMGDGLILAILSHALMPAILEEMLFRYIPMRLLSSCSRGTAVLLSAVFFALVHHSFFVIPYAFFAGVVFMAIDLVCDSVIPSILLHFINNALSVSIIVCSDNPAFVPVIATVLSVLSLLSLAFVIKRKDEYKRRFAPLFVKKEGFSPTLPFVGFASVCLILAALGLA